MVRIKVIFINFKSEAKTEKSETFVEKVKPKKIFDTK